MKVELDELFLQRNFYRISFYQIQSAVALDYCNYPVTRQYNACEVDMFVYFELLEMIFAGCRIR